VRRCVGLRLDLDGTGRYVVTVDSLSVGSLAISTNPVSFLLSRGRAPLFSLGIYGSSVVVALLSSAPSPGSMDARAPAPARAAGASRTPPRAYSIPAKHIRRIFALCLVRVNDVSVAVSVAPHVWVFVKRLSGSLRLNASDASQPLTLGVRFFDDVAALVALHYEASTKPPPLAGRAVAPLAEVRLQQRCDECACACEARFLTNAPTRTYRCIAWRAVVVVVR
jgi:hypothetical protein